MQRCTVIARAAAALVALALVGCSPHYGGYGPPPAQPAPPPPQPTAPAPPPGAAPVDGRANNVVQSMVCMPDQKLAQSHIVIAGALVAKSDCVVRLSHCEIRGGIFATRDAKVQLSHCVVHGNVRVTHDAELEADASTRFTGHLSTEAGGKIKR